MFRYRFIRSKRSVASDYVYLFGTMLTLILMLILWFTLQVYHSQKHIQMRQLISKTNRLNTELTTTFNYTSNLMHFIGEQILEQPNNLEYIVRILRNPLVTNEVASNIASWVLFQWSNANQKLMACSIQGVFKDPKDVSKRMYARAGKLNPWVLMLDRPDIGMSSGEWIIPAGMGVYDARGQYTGSISAGFSIAKLSQKLTQVAGDFVQFIIIDKNSNQIVMHSTDHTINELVPMAWEKAMNGQPKTISGFISSPIENGDLIYEYFYYMEKYPYIILTGYNKSVAKRAFQETLLPGIVGFTSIGLVSCVALIWLRYLLVLPITQLSNMANSIVNNKPVPKIKGLLTYETTNLTIALLKIKRLMQKEKSHKSELEEAVEIARKSDEAKEKFISNIKKHLKQKINFLVQNLSTLYQDCSTKDGIIKPNNKELLKYLKQLLEIACEIQTFEIKEFAQNLINITSTLQECITIEAKRALRKKIKITLDIAGDLPQFITDEMCFKQVIVSLISRSIEYSPSNRVIIIKVNKERKGDKDFLVITIDDNGFGFTEEYIQKISIQFDDTNYEDGTNISLFSIKQLVNILGGECQLHSTFGKGTFVCLSFLLYHHNLERFDDQTQIASNVVKFSRPQPES